MQGFHAILLCAGLGSRLLPLTADRPKCLIEVGGKPILAHQLDAVRAAGASRVTVVGGYRLERLEEWVAGLPEDVRPELVFNPFFADASSIASVWLMREALAAGDFLVMNGDTVYAPEVVRGFVGGLGQGVSLGVEAIDRASADDMFVRIADGTVTAVGKGLLGAHHRSLGMIACVGEGAGYCAALDDIVRSPAGVHRFHHDIVHALAQEQRLAAVELSGAWVEIDRPADIAAAEASGSFEVERRKVARDARVKSVAAK